MSDDRLAEAASPVRWGSLAPLLTRHQAGSSNPGSARLYMLLDAARDPAIFPWLGELGDAIEIRSLYQGDIGDNLAHVSPYLLSLRDNQPEALRLADSGLGRDWGLFVTAAIGFDDLRRHLRKFNLVYREDGTPLIFRFYDPRVLRVFLPTCTEAELRRFFGPIDAFWTEAPEPDTLLRLSLRDGALSQTRLSLQP